jgi:hypothetical protein
MKYLSRADVLAERQPGSITVALSGNGLTGDGDLWGDVNVDGVVDIYDLIRFAKYLAAVPAAELTARGLYLADVDRNDKVDLGDLMLLARYLASADMSNPDITLGIQQ